MTTDKSTKLYVSKTRFDDDKLLQDELALLVSRLGDENGELHEQTLGELKDLIQAATTSITSVPKPLKYLRPHYTSMKEAYSRMRSDRTRQWCAAILSVLAITLGSEQECLLFRFMSDPSQEIGEWGHEYVRHLGGVIINSWNHKTAAFLPSRLLDLAIQATAYHMSHNAETEACDLLMEIDQIDLIRTFVDQRTFPKVLHYLQACAPFVPPLEKAALLKTSLNLARKFKSYVHAIRLALKLHDTTIAEEIFKEAETLSMRKQIAFVLARHHTCFSLYELADDCESVRNILLNTNWHEWYLKAAEHLGCLEPKEPEDIFKSHLDRTMTFLGGDYFHSARRNLALSFVNGFINAGFGTDKYLTVSWSKWVYKHKDQGMISATAALGLIHLWDVEGGLNAIEQYFHSANDYIRAGALLGCGIMTSSIRSDIDPAYAILVDYVQGSSATIRACAILGLGIAYAGSDRSDIVETICGCLVEIPHTDKEFEVTGIAALSLGLVSTATCNPRVSELLLGYIMVMEEKQLSHPSARFVILGLGLLYLGREEKAETVLYALAALRKPFDSMARTVVDVCAFAGTGNVLKVQELLHICSEHHTVKETKKNIKPNYEKIRCVTQAIAALGIAIIAMGDEIGTEMATRSLGHLLCYTEPCLRRATPLALGLLSVSNVRMNILQILSKLSHDTDPNVVCNSIFALGLLGAGTTNARLASTLRQLAQYHAGEPLSFFMVRIAQGLVHLGKGMLTLDPFDTERQLMNPIAMGSLFATLMTFLDYQRTILSRSHFLLYTLVPAMRTRVLVTLNESLEMIPMPVRVGLAVDVVGQAGTPKTITGFQTHTTPVLINAGQRAELASDEFVPLSPVLEDFVIFETSE